MGLECNEVFLFQVDIFGLLVSRHLQKSTADLHIVRFLHRL